MNDGERGSVALWILGLAMMLLLVGGISIDLWRLAGERRELAAVADAAAVAAASAVDESVWRQEGKVQLDSARAGEAARAVIAGQRMAVRLGEDWLEVRGEQAVVRLERQVDLTLLRLAHPQPVVVRASGRAAAVLGS